MGRRVNIMEKQKLFFSKKEKVYYYVTYGELSICDICDEEIDKILVYHASWRKRSAEIRTYHIKCYQKIFSRGHIDEFKTCVVIDEMPEDIHPIFERKPALANSAGTGIFETHKFKKGSEAEIKDRTRIAKDPHQSFSPNYNKNLKMFEKKEEEQGDSIFLLQDKQRDKFMQVEDEKKRKETQIDCKVAKIKEDGIEVEIQNKFFFIKKEELPIAPDRYQLGQKVIARIKSGDLNILASLSLSLKKVVSSSRKRAYPEDIETKEANMNEFLENVKSSEILLPHQDFLELLSSKELNNKKFSIEDKSK